LAQAFSAQGGEGAHNSKSPRAVAADSPCNNGRLRRMGRSGPPPGVDDSATGLPLPAPPGPEVHTLWVGDELPVWVVGCVESYLKTGHVVNWWVFVRDERQADLDCLTHIGLIRHPALRIRDVAEVLPYVRASRFFFHGLGPDGQWRGWAPFSDWFRYEIMSRFGGWWVDADGVSVRSLRDLEHHDTNGGVGVPIICTERHCLDRRMLGAVAIAAPSTTGGNGDVEKVAVEGPLRSGGGAGAGGGSAVSSAQQPEAEAVLALQAAEELEVRTMVDGRPATTALPVAPPSPVLEGEILAGERIDLAEMASSAGHRIPAFWDWVRRAEENGRDVCLITNNHFWTPRGTPFMRELAHDMRDMLERYARQVEMKGVGAVRRLRRSGESRSAIPHSNIGMVLFQRAVRRLAGSGAGAGSGGRSCACRVLHWSVFNPIDAKDALRMRRVLTGEEVLRGRWVHTVHMFRQVRDEWRRHLLEVPRFTLQVSDEAPLAKPRRPSLRLRCRPRFKAVEIRELPRPEAPLLKRRRLHIDGVEVDVQYRSTGGEPLYPLSLRPGAGSGALVSRRVDGAGRSAAAPSKPLPAGRRLAVAAAPICNLALASTGWICTKKRRGLQS